MTEEAVTPSDLKRLDAQLDALHLSHVKGHYQAFATTAAQKQFSHLEYLAELIEGEAARRETRAIERRIKNARFPVLKTMEDFEWSWPKKINRPQIQNLFRLAFIATNTNVVFISTVGLGKTHIAIALGRAACVGGHSVLFTTAVDIINRLAAAQSAGRLKREIGRYLKPGLLIIDLGEVQGYVEFRKQCNGYSGRRPAGAPHNSEDIYSRFSQSITSTAAGDRWPACGVPSISGNTCRRA
jgi:DNA replication protein DnaC